ncbi:preprotein translocase subunit SecE [Candidatus Saccharibacteria bacterium]|nr:preprotein translocase subunit SecE [Candidatus Saccharibacteria bacterium]MCL1962839.1 preprotein translocase subunit SecE [Candidatus Saccharibacteria bacterium]
MAKDNSGKGTVVRRIKASGGRNSSAARTEEKEIVRKVSTTKPVKTDKKSAKKADKVAKVKRERDPNKKSFVLFRPIFAIGRYFRDAWRELRQVQWTNRRATWALTLAVILFSAFFAILVLVFDWLFQWSIKEVIL